MLATEVRQSLDKYCECIRTIDSTVREKSGKIMSQEGVVFEQEGVFKYGLTQTKKHYSFHSMVMYSDPMVMAFTKQILAACNVRIQKGCVNFESINDLPLSLFEQILRASVQADFSQTISHYKAKK